MSEFRCTAGIATVALGESQWAVHPFVGEKAHYWLIKDEFEGNYLIESACGHEAVATNRVLLLNSGNWPHCKLCERRK